MKHYLDDYVINLLHINDAKSNKMIDLLGADPKKVYFLSREGNDNFSEYMLLNIQKNTQSTFQLFVLQLLSLTFPRTQKLLMR